MEKAYKTCIEIFEQRGYSILETDDERILAIKPDGYQICAFLTNTTKKLNINVIQECIYSMKQMEINHAFIIYKEFATPVAKKVIEDSDKMVIELFSEDELQYNCTKHYLVPKHELLYKKDTEEAKEFRKNKFPLMLKTDPIARFYGYKAGDIIKITRKNGTIMYRIVR